MKIRAISYLLIFVAFGITNIPAQITGDGFHYKTRLVDNTGTGIANQQVDIMFTIIDQMSNVLYQEVHTTNTDDNGIVDVVIGEGTAIQGNFINVVWGERRFLNVQIDFGGGWIDYGTKPLKYVPFAKKSDIATTALEVDFNDLTNVPAGWLDGNDATGGVSDINGLADAKTYSNGKSVYLGSSSGQSDDNSDNFNTGVGYYSLHLNTSGDYNTALGAYALYSNTTSTQNTAAGYKSLYKNDATGNTAAGHHSMKENLTGDYNVSLGSYAMEMSTYADHNVAVGTNALNQNDGDFNVGVGSNALPSNTTGENNVAVGFQSLKQNTTGSSNIAIGPFALYSNTDKSGLIAIGDSALYNNGTGATSATQAVDNLAIGHKALFNNTTGSGNIAAGNRAMLNNQDGNDNIAIGVDALMSNTSGNGNVAIGTEALKNNTTGSSNVAVGYRAMFDNVTGNFNTAIGREAGFSAPDLNNTTAIGYAAGGVSNVSDRMEIGNTSVTQIFSDVNWSTYSDRRIKKDIKENVPGWEFISRLRPVTYRLDIHKMNHMISRGKKESKYLKEWPGKYDIEKIRMTGFIAQEVEQAAKEAGYDFSGVQKANDDLGMYSISYAQFVVPLVKLTQEQQESIRQLKIDLTNLQERLQAAKEKNKRLTEKLKKLLEEYQSKQEENLVEEK